MIYFSHPESNHTPKWFNKWFSHEQIKNKCSTDHPVYIIALIIILSISVCVVTCSVHHSSYAGMKTSLRILLSTNNH